MKVKSTFMVFLAFATLFSVLQIKLVSADVGQIWGFTFESRFEAAANQGVTTDGTFLWADSEYTGTWQALYKYTKEGEIVAFRDRCDTDGTAVRQINGLFYKDGLIYAGSTSFPDEPYANFVKIYNATDLDYIEEFPLLGLEICEGVQYHDGSFWATWGESNFITEYDDSWVMQANYTLTYDVTFKGVSGYGYQGSTWVGDYIYCNIHQDLDKSKVDVYYWNGTGFEERVRLDQPTVRCGQGMGYDPVETNIMWFAERSLNDPHYIVRAVINWVEPDSTNVAIDVTNMNAGNWLIAEEKYYEFEATYAGESTLDFAKIRFQDDHTDVDEWIIAYYDYAEDIWGIEKGSDKILIREGSTTVDGIYLIATFKILLRSAILDETDVNLEMWVNDTAGSFDGWDEIQTDYCNFYHLGGLGTLVTSGTAGRIAGGDIFELYAEDASWAEATMLFHDLQHVHMLYHIWIADQESWDDWETDTITIEMGIDYYSIPDDAWLEGWSVSIEQYEGWIAPATMRLRWNVAWNYRGAQVYTATMNSFPLVNQTEDGLPAQTSFITDFWFNKVNASSTIGGRITSEYYAMRDNANAWLRWATGGNWGVDVGNVTQAMFFDDLEKSSTQLISSKQVDMMRVWVNISQESNVNDVRVELRDFDLFDIEIAVGEMEGINTPIFTTTKTPDMPQSGFLASLSAAISGFFGSISDNFSPALLAFWETFVSFLDTALSITGIPNLFTMITEIIGNFFVWISDSVTWLTTGLTAIFLLLAETMLKITSVITVSIGQWVLIIANTLSMISGGFGQTYDIFVDLRLDLWIIVMAIFYPVYLLGIWETRGLDALMNHLNMIMNFFAFFIHTFLSIISFFWDLITGIIEAIPIVE